MAKPDPISMREIAAAAGVSVSAVSLALRNSPKVSPDRRREILTLAERLGYRRDPRISELMEHLRMARAQRAPSRVAVVIPELTVEQLQHYPPILGLIAGVREVAELAGFGVDCFHLADPGMSCARLRSILIARGIKGVVLAPCASGVATLDFDCAGLYAATAGYSITAPRLHRACPNYLQMMDEILQRCTELGYRRVGLVMTYGEGGIGHKLFTSSFLFYQTKIPAAARLPILPKPEINAVNLRAWLAEHRPDVVISAGSVYRQLRAIGVDIPGEIGFASIDVSEPPAHAAGADHRYVLVGREALKLVLTCLNLNLTGVPTDPKVVLVDSHWREGATLRPKPGARKKPQPRTRPEEVHAPVFRGFLD